jgi:hypothetical protein
MEQPFLLLGVIRDGFWPLFFASVERDLFANRALVTFVSATLFLRAPTPLPAFRPAIINALSLPPRANEDRRSAFARSFTNCGALL